MKIVHISYTHRYDDIRIYEKECKSLKKHGYDVIHIASDKLTDISCVSELAVPVKVIKLATNSRTGVVLDYWKQVKREIDLINPEICHLHDWQLWPLVLSLRKKYKVIIDSHEDFPEYLSSTMLKSIPQGVKKKVIYGIEKFLFKRATWIVAANKHIESELLKITKNVTAIKNYPIIFDKKGNNSYAPQFCYIGGISDYLGGTVISKALHNLDTRLKLVGKTDLNYLNEIQELSGNKIDNLGFQNKSTVRKIIKESRAGLVVYLPTPNCVHALPNKMFEYLEAEVPIICSDFPDWRDLLEEKKCCIFVNPASEQEVREAMKYFLENPKEAEQMGKNGRIAVETEFNWEKEEMKLIELYKKL